ncbi:phosphotransferase enzyme family protein [Actinomadura rifamycini]|uniref:phosphotransferase enzyme family protein n=1 Tax=Actinomadura rifamycini TaxID=31962 RepID=UPI000411F1C9|nr:phosphotransferase [Actinomadura rifamycini]
MPTSQSADAAAAGGHGAGRDAGPPARLLRRWDLGPDARFAGPGPDGAAVRRSRRIDTANGAYLLKEHPAPDRRRILFRHRITAALDAAGLPVLAPVPARTGRTLVTAAGRGYELFPWAGGRGRDGLELTFAQCEELGGLLGRLHAEMERLTPPVQQSMLVPAPRAADAAAAVDALLAAVPRGGGTDFAALTERRLRERRALLAEFADHQPPDAEVCTVGHLHGSFHGGNLRYGGSGNVTAVLGWDGLTTGPVAGEVVRAAARLFAGEDDRGLDLDRVQAFVRGHRASFPLDAGQIQSAVHRAWWERLCDVAPLRQRYLGEDGAAGSGAPDPAQRPPQERGHAALVTWWSAHLERTLDAFAAPYAPGAGDGPAAEAGADGPGDGHAYG